MLWNARSILGNLGEFQKCLDENNPHLICLTETWLKADKKLGFKAYSVIRKDRPNQAGGGIAILIRKEIEYKDISFIPFNGGRFEYMGIKIKLGGEVLNIILFYNPVGSIEEQELEFYISQVNGNKLICGDFNAKHPLWDSCSRNTAGNVLFNVLTKSTSLSLLTPQDLPTRYDPVTNKSSTLDLFVGSNKYISNCNVTSSNLLGTSDHIPTYLIIGERPDWNPISFRGKWKIDDNQWPAWYNEAKKLIFSPY